MHSLINSSNCLDMQLSWLISLSLIWMGKCSFKISHLSKKCILLHLWNQTDFTNISVWIGKKMVEVMEYNILTFLEGILNIIKLYAWLCFQRYMPILHCWHLQMHWFISYDIYIIAWSLNWSKVTQGEKKTLTQIHLILLKEFLKQLFDSEDVIVY